MAQQELSFRYWRLLTPHSCALFLQQVNSIVQQVPFEVSSTTQLVSCRSTNTSIHDHGGRLLVPKHSFGFQWSISVWDRQRSVDKIELEHACVRQAADVSAQHALLFGHSWGQIGQSSQRNLQTMQDWWRWSEWCHRWRPLSKCLTKRAWRR